MVGKIILSCSDGWENLLKDQSKFLFGDHYMILMKFSLMPSSYFKEKLNIDHSWDLKCESVLFSGLFIGVCISLTLCVSS